MKSLVAKEIQDAIQRLHTQGVWPASDLAEAQEILATIQDNLNTPDVKTHGDYSSPVALRLAKVLRASPMILAKQIAEDLIRPTKPSKTFDRVEVAAPGFLNFFLTSDSLVTTVTEILDQDKKYGTSDMFKGQKILVEFISANPTGPLTFANGRGGFTGDVLAHVLKSLGAKTQREFYVNDRGVQIDTLAESVIRRWLLTQGIKVDFPENLYQGEYISDLVKVLKLDVHTQASVQELTTLKKELKGKALKYMLKDIQGVIQDKMGIQFDEYFSEASLYKTGEIQEMLSFLKQAELVYEKDGATWMRTTNFGDDKDRVLIKSDGEMTYFLSDVAYHWNKFHVRKFTWAINLLGADHHGYIGRLKAAVEAMSIAGKFKDKPRMDILIMQMVRLMKNGEEVRMSKRKGQFITIEEVIDEVGIDAVRFFFLLYASNTHMDFDLALAKEKNEKNPVYYVQYAHARISSILKQIKTPPPIKHIHLQEQGELALAKHLLQYPDLLKKIGQDFTVHALPQYTIEVARLFHAFYAKCRVIEDEKVNPSRYALIRATQIVLKNALSMMGISAPKSM